MVQHARQRLVGAERHETFRRPLHRVLALRQLLDDRQRALTMVATDRVAGLSRRVESLAADLRQTPPEVILAKKREWLLVLEQAVANFMSQRLRRARDAVTDLSGRLGTRHPRAAVVLAAQRLDTVELRLRQGMTTVCRREEQRVAALARHLSAVSPEQVLKRGYSITTRKRDGKVVRSAKDLRAGERIVTRFADGQTDSTVDDGNQPRLFE
jgi:exodeoxyribonuclease VII large subunit